MTDEEQMTDLEIMQILIKAKELGITQDDVTKYRATYNERGTYVTEYPATYNERGTYVKDEKAEDMVKPLSIFDEVSDEEMLYYATPYFDELQEKKEAHQKRLTEGE